MNTTATVMNTVPFAGNLAMAAVAFVAAGMIVVAGYVVRDSLRQRREAALVAANANPELEAFGLPMPVVAKTKRTVDTGAILRAEGFSV